MDVVHPISEHAVVRFLSEVRGWPAGTVGTVVGDYGGVVLVEVSGDNGVALDFVQMPVAQLELKR
jgi:hypothetical protein